MSLVGKRKPSQLIYVKQHTDDPTLLKIGQSHYPAGRFLKGFLTVATYDDKDKIPDTDVHYEVMKEGIVPLPCEKFKGDINHVHAIIMSMGFTCMSKSF